MSRPRALNPDSIYAYCAEMAYDDLLNFHKQIGFMLTWRATAEKKEPPAEPRRWRARKQKAHEEAEVQR